MTLNLATWIRDNAHRQPDHPALIAGASQWSHAELHAAVQRTAGLLLELGIERGDHVALMLPNVPEFVISYFACHYLGAVVVPLNVLLAPDEVEFHLRDSEAVALVAWHGLRSTAQQGFDRVARCRHLLVAGDDADAGGAIPLGPRSAAAAPVAETAATMPDDTAVVLYTSGTTGKPKGAELSQFNLFFNAEYVAFKLTPFTRDSRGLVALPLFHSFGQTVTQNALVAAGGSLVLLPRFDPGEAWRLMREHRVNAFAGVPTMFFAMLHHDAPGPPPQLRYCVSGGAPMPVEVMKAFDQKFGVDILEGYGLSETSPVASFNVLDHPKKPGSIGRPILGVEFRLLDDEDHVVDAVETPGEICIKGHNVMKGYYKQPEATAAAMQDGWFRTGDIGVVDADGYYRIVDRKKDMILRGGFNVYPREVEEVLYAHPAIAEAAVLGVPDAEHGEEVAAYVALKPGHTATAEELIAYCKEHVAAYKYPRQVHFLDTLPKGSTGKILKRALRDG